MFCQRHEARFDRPCRRVFLRDHLVRRGKEDVAIAEIDQEGDTESGAVPPVEDDAGGPYSPPELDVREILGCLRAQVGFAM